MPTLTIVANITAKTDKIDLVKAELEKLILITRAEEGCINYDLHQEHGNPAHFLFYENWETREHWQTHMETPHIQGFQALADGAVADVTVLEMSQIG